MFRTLILSLVLAIFTLLFNGTISQAKTKPFEYNEAVSSENKNSGPEDPKELESFLDKFIIEKMEEYHIPGLVFVLVKDDEIFFTKGYGYADLDKKIPVKPDETLFRVGSVSKLFTATAAMQLYEQGHLDLNTNVNEYLKLFKLEENYPKPVTVANLLAHTAGFRGRAIGYLTLRESDRIPLSEFLAANVPPRALPPGSVISYSNHGFYLAGHLVEEISGVPFAQYVADSILLPLGMEKSSFLMLPHLLPNLAKSYSFSNGNYKAVPVRYSIPESSPAGSMIATANDMARFMIAHLQGGRFGDNRILNEGTCREMHQQQFTNHARLPGTCYGFYEYSGHSQRAIFHDGDIAGFSSRLFLLPDLNLGIFVCNNGDNSRFRMQLTDQFLSHYYPTQEQTSPSQPSTDFKLRGKRLTGSYRSLRLGLDSIDKLASMGDLINIKDSYVNSWIEIGPLLFQVTKSETRLAFREDSEGNITHLFFDAQQMPVSLEKLAWYDTPTFLWISSGFILFVFLSAYAFWPIMHRIRRRRKQSAESNRSARRARILAILTVTLNLIFILGFTPSMFLLEDELVYGVPLVITALLIIPIITSVLTVGLPVFSVLAWKHKYWSFVERLHYSLIAFTCMGFILWLHHWNLLGFRY
jgi:CubicO group peptidase (beta-lactamase class C family)